MSTVCDSRARGGGGPVRKRHGQRAGATSAGAHPAEPAAQPRRGSCGVELSMDPRPFALAVKALIHDAGGRLLVLRRSVSSRHFAGLWELPGGKLDPGESFDQGLLREVAEETGLTIALEKVAGATQYDLPAVRVAVLLLDARLLGGALQLSAEHDEFQWVTLAELVELALGDPLKAFFQARQDTAARGRD